MGAVYQTRGGFSTSINCGILADMDATLLFGEYFVWHYSASVRDFFVMWGNMFWFGYHFFSMRLLARTLFTPFKRFHQEYDLKNLNLGVLGQDIMLNLFMRMLGAVLRLCVLAFGLIFEIAVLLVGMVSLVIWLLLPLIIPLLALGGVFLLLG